MEIEQPFEEYDAEERYVDDNGYSIPCYYCPKIEKEMADSADLVYKLGSFYYIDSKIYEMLCSWIYSKKRDKKMYSKRF